MTPLEALAQTCTTEIESYLATIQPKDAELFESALAYKKLRELPFGDTQRQEFWRALASQIPDGNPLRAVADFVDVVERQSITEEFHITLFHALGSLNSVKRSDLCVRLVDAIDESKLKAEMLASGFYKFDEYLLLKAVCLTTPGRAKEACEILKPLFEKFCLEEDRTQISAGWSLAEIYKMLGNKPAAIQSLKVVLQFCQSADNDSGASRYVNIINETEERIAKLS